ncbi:MAG: hypothetical protein F4098_00990, partial [Acidimicrobiaceae bacterium]|nr:hypothetical protein [Acidimicrobiaceae bacterium]
TVTDDDTAGVVVSESAVAVREDGTDSGSWTVVLATQPTDVVEVTVSGDSSAVLVDGAAEVVLTFTSSGWDTAQTVTVAGVDDDVVNDGGERTVVVSHTAVSDDSNYEGLAGGPVSVAVIDDDDDLPVVSVTAGPGSIVEGSDAVFVLRVPRPLSGAVTVDYTVTQSGGFVDPGDLGAKQATLAAGAVFVVVSVPTVGDSVDETDGSVTVTVDTGEGYTPSAGAGAVSVAVADDDDPPTGIVLSVDPQSLVETAGVSVVTVTASVEGPSRFETALGVSVSLGVSDGGVGVGVDRSVIVLLIPAGADEAVFDVLVTPTADGVDTADGRVVFSGVASGGVSVTDAVLTVTDAEATPVVVSGGGFVTEADPASSVDVSVVLGRALAVGETAVLEVWSTGTAADLDAVLNNASDAGVSWTPAGEGAAVGLLGVLVFTAGADSAVLSLTAAAGAVEGHRRVGLSLGAGQDPGAVGLGGGLSLSGEVWLVMVDADADAAAVLAGPASLSVSEDGDAASVLVRLSEQPSGLVQVWVDPVDLSAVSASPRQLTFDSDDWDTARTVSVTAPRDADAVSEVSGLVLWAEGHTSALVQVKVADTGRFPQSDAVFATPLPELVIAENTDCSVPQPPSACVLGVVSAVDADGDVVAYGLEGPRPDKGWPAGLVPPAPAGFTVDPSSGVVSYGGAGLDHEAAPTVSLVVTAASTGAAGVPATVYQPVTVEVTNVDEGDAVVSVSGAAVAGRGELTVAALSGDVDGDPDTWTVAWQSSADGRSGWSAASGATTAGVHSVAASDAGGWLRAEVSYVDGGGHATTVHSDPLEVLVLGLLDVFLTTPATVFDAVSGDSVSVTVSLGEPLAAGETVTVPLVFTGATPGSGVALTLSSAAGVALESSTVTFTGGSQNAVTAGLTVELTTAPAGVVSVSLGALSATGQSLEGTRVAGSVTGSGVLFDPNPAPEVPDPDVPDPDVPDPDDPDDPEDPEVPDPEVAGVALNVTALSVSENKGEASYEIVLTGEPAAAVTVTATSSDPAVVVSAGGSASGSVMLTFDSDDWDTAQTVTVTGVDNDVDEPGGSRVAVLTHSAASDDPAYQDAGPSVQVSVVDDEPTTVSLSRSKNQPLYEGVSSSLVKVQLGRGLVAGEAASIPLTVTGEGVTAGDYALSLHSGTGARLDSAVTSPTLVLSGEGAETAWLSLRAKHDYVDEADETLSVTVLAAGLTAGVSGLAGGLALDEDASSAGFVIVDHKDDTAALVVSSSRLLVSETGSGSYLLWLGSRPAAEVTVTVASGEREAALVSAAGSGPAVSVPVVFTAEGLDWAQPRTVTIHGVDDQKDGSRSVAITHTAVSEDTGYEGLAETKTVIVVDDDTAAVTVSVSLLSVAEPSGEAAYQISLATQPAADVTVTVTSADSTVAVVSSGGSVPGGSAVLTFTPTDWATAQTVTVQAVDDHIDDPAGPAGGRMAALTHAVVSDDAVYDALRVNGVLVTVVDDDTAGVTVTETQLSVAEPSGEGSYTVRLDSQPAADVVVTATSGDPATARVSVGGSAPGGSAVLTFTPESWAVEQTVTVTGVDNDIVDASGSRTATIGHSVAGYGAVTSAAGVSVTVVDSDGDSASVAVSQTSVSVPESTSSTVFYTLRLTSAPTGDVTVTATAPAGIHVDGASTAAVSFTPTNWNTAVTVTVTADGSLDGDTVDGPDRAAGSITHAVSGYGTVTSAADVAVSVVDDDPTTVTLTAPDPFEVFETDTARTAELTVALSRALTAGETADVALRLISTTQAALSGPVRFRTLDWHVSGAGVSLHADDNARRPGPYGNNIVLRFAGPGAQTASLVFNATDKDRDAADETVEIAVAPHVLLNHPDRRTSLSGGLQAAAGADNAELTIKEDTVASFKVHKNVNEGNTISVGVALSKEAPAGGVTVAYTVGGTATSGVDYSALSGAVTFAAGADDAVIAVAAMDDVVNEGPETVILTLVEGAGYAVAGDASNTVTVTINDDDAAPTAVALSVSPTSITESASGSDRDVTVTATVQGATRFGTAKTVRVTATKTGGVGVAAIAAFDVVIAAGEASGSATVTVVPQPDDVDEVDAVVAFTGAVDGDSSVSVTGASLIVTDDDGDDGGDPAVPVVSVTAGAASVVEGANGSFTVSVSPAPTGTDTVVVSYTVTQSGEYVASGDLGAKSVTVGSSGSATVSVPTVG